MSVRPSRVQQLAIYALLPFVSLLRFLPRSKGRPLTAPDFDWIPYRSAGDIMRRRVNGEFELRAMTDAEHRQYMGDRWG